LHFVLEFSEYINNNKLQGAANTIRAVNHELRQQLLEYISQHEPVMVSKIYHTLGIEQSVCSQHLKILRDAEFVNAKREGKKVLYSVNYERLKQFKQLLQQI
jgi:ArsR family transcriptional regulator